MFKKIWFLLWMFIATVAQADLYTVTGISVAAEQDNALTAKEAALSEGQLEAFNLLLVRLAGEDALTQIPPQTTESVTQFVQDVSIENEKLTTTRYAGHITVRFNQQAVTDLLKKYDISYLDQEAPSLLVIPVYQDGNAQYILNERNPLYQSLKQQTNFAPFYRATVPTGDAEEVALTEQALRTQQLSLLVPLLNTYHKDKILVLRMRTEPLEQAVLFESSIWPPQGMSSQNIAKRFRVESSIPKETYTQMAQVVFDNMATNWRREHMARLDGKRTIYARVPVTSLQNWQDLEKEMQTWQFVDQVVVRGAYLPQMLVELSFTQSVDELKQSFLEYGWQLNPDFTGPGATLTKGVTYE